MKQLLLAVILFPVSLFAQDKYPIQPEIEIDSYQVYIELNDTTNTIVGKNIIHFTLREKTNLIEFDLVGKSQEKGMLVQGVFCESVPLNYRHINNRISVELTTELIEKKGGDITILYEGEPIDGLIISENKFGERTFFGDNWPNRAHNWFPCIDHPSKKAKITFEVLAPSNYQVISNGKIKSIEKKGDYNRTIYSTKNQLPTKVMVIGVARFSTAICDTTNNLLQQAYVYPQEQENGLRDYCTATDILRWFEKKLGNYPFEKLAHVQSKTRYGGMENAGCIFYHENSIDGKGGSEYLFAHEIAHQWFGNSATEKDWHHVWLSEGFATYLTEVYKQETAGQEAFLEGMESARNKIIGYTKKNPAGKIIDTNITNLNKLLSPMTYQKAAWMLHMLRQIVGDEIFWKGLNLYYTKYAYKNALSKDFISAMERACSCSLTSFFDTWLYQPGLPKIALDYTYNAKEKELKITLEQDVANWFVVPVQFSGLPNFKAIMDQPKSTFTIKNTVKPTTKFGVNVMKNVMKW